MMISRTEYKTNVIDQPIDPGHTVCRPNKSAGPSLSMSAGPAGPAISESLAF